LGISAPSSYAPPVGAGAGAGAAIGASQGASIGTTIVPGIGTAIGAIVGAIGGAIAGSLHKTDPEQYQFDAAIAVWQSNPSAIYYLSNKYLPLAGFFDLTQSQAGKIRIYRKFGRMGEQAFVNALVQLVQGAANSGQITAADTPISIYQRVVLPWEDSWGYGPEPQNPHSDFMAKLITGLILDYVTGNQKNWTARSGDYPFATIQPFTLPAPATTPAQTPSVVPVGSAVTTPAISPSVPPVTNPTILPPIAQPVTYPPGAPVPLLVSPVAPPAATVPAGTPQVGTDVNTGFPQAGQTGPLLPITPVGTSSGPPTTTPTQPTTTTTTPTAAGVSLGGWWGVAAIGATLLFATARPAKMRRRRTNAR